MRNNSSSLSLRKSPHPEHQNSQVNIFNLTQSLKNIQQNGVDTLIQTKYNAQQRKFLIVDKARGKYIDSRLVNVQKEMQASLKESYYMPSPTKKNNQEEEFIYEPVIDIPQEDDTGSEKVKLRKKQSQGSTKSVWESTWKQYDKIHEKFLQSIIRNQLQTFANLLDKRSSTFPIDINYRYQNNWAAIHYTAMQSCSQFMGKLINQPQINVNILTDFNENALHIAAKSNNLQNCLMLIEAKVSLDKSDNDKNTALHYASQLGYQEIAKVLLKSGASCVLKNCMGMTAIDIAVPQLNDIFQPYKRSIQQENPLYRNRSSHRTMIERMLQTRNRQEIVIPPPEQKKQKRDAQFWRKKNIFKLYNLMKDTKPNNNVTLSQFQFYKKIGEGAFGQVHLVKRVGFDDNLYALKAIKKERVNGTSLYRYIQTQREILSLVDHPFIVRLRFAFQTDDYLFLVMDYCEGGDLSRLLHKRRRFTQKQVKNYACELLLALQALHKYNIIYRDLKPENIVVDKDGHVLITDFGLSKKIQSIQSMNRSFCGTPAYIPLEIINKKGHNRMVDWYQYGVVLYELYVGSPPYHADTKRQLYQIVKKGIVRFSKNTPPLLKDLIKKLLAQNPQNRLGFEKDAESIRQHPWFNDVNWEDVLERRLEMPKIENNIALGDPICSKFIDIKGNKFNMPLWSFVE